MASHQLTSLRPNPDSKTLVLFETVPHFQKHAVGSGMVEWQCGINNLGGIMRYKSFAAIIGSALYVLASIFGAAALATGSEALAQLNGTGIAEKEMVGGSQLRLQNSFNEARNGEHLMEVWRGADNNTVWISCDNGRPFTFRNAITTQSPTVVAWGASAFMVLFVGTDNQINYAIFNSDGEALSGDWQQIRNQTTTRPVSAVQMYPDSTQIFLVYQGADTNPFVWTTWFNGSTWSPAAVIQNGRAESEPAVARNPATGRLFVVTRGINNRLWMTNQLVGASQWPAWVDLNIEATGAASIAAASNGSMVVTVPDAANRNQLVEYNSTGTQIEGPVPDETENTGAIGNSVELTAVGSQIYALYNLGNKGYNRRIL
jgi:hypothetical protein